MPEALQDTTLQLSLVIFSLEVCDRIAEIVSLHSTFF